MEHFRKPELQETPRNYTKYRNSSGNPGVPVKDLKFKKLPGTPEKYCNSSRNRRFPKNTETIFSKIKIQQNTGTTLKNGTPRNSPELQQNTSTLAETPSFQPILELYP